MADNSAKPADSEIEPVMDKNSKDVDEKSSSVDSRGVSGGGWSGWGFSPLSYYLSDLQKAANMAAEEISRSAAEVARTAAKTFSETIGEDLDSSEEDKTISVEEETDDENDKQRKAALEKLEKASQESFLSQGLMVLDTSVESFASGAWQAFGTALKGGATLVQKIEDSASNLTDSIQHGSLPESIGSAAPSLLETGKAFTAKSMQVLEKVGKETIDLLISETGIQAQKKSGGRMDEDLEEITFDRCFYIYGGPEQLEELEALSNHYTLLYNRRKVKLSSEEKSLYDGKLKEVHRMFDLGAEVDGNFMHSGKGKKVEAGDGDNIDELKKLHDSSLSKAAELAAGFASVLSGLSPNDIIQKTSGRLDALHSEGVHRLSEMCCFAVTQILTLGKSIISNANKGGDQDTEERRIYWPEDSVEKAKIVRRKADSMNGNIEAVFNSFITGLSEVAEAYVAAIKGVGVAAESPELLSRKSVQGKAGFFEERLSADHSTAVRKLQDGLQYLPYLVLANSMSSI